MEWPPVLLLFVFHLWVYGCFGCSHAERSALLELKSSMNLPTDLVTSWGIGHCCSWDIVTCNSSTGRVIELELKYTRFFDADLGDWYLNASLLLPFDELRSLDLSYNKMKGLIDEQAFKRWSRVSKLEELILGFNILNNTILPHVGAFKFLKILDVGHNKFQGPLPTKGLCKLKNLQELDLSFNEFEGAIPYCLGSLTSLQRLTLSNNQFSGKIPMLSIANLTSLVEFSVTNNNLSGLVTLCSFAHLSKLEDFDLSNNDLEVETEYPPWNATFQLEYLGLSNCTLNKHTGGIPSFLYNQHDLIEVDLSHNHVLGKFSIGLLKNKTSLVTLNLKNNSLSGTFHLPLDSNGSAMSTLDISNNYFTGQLPFNMGTFFPDLGELRMSRNSFQGSIPPSIGDMRSLGTLDLSHNNLSGEVPDHLFDNCVLLQVLMLSNNSLQGKIFSISSNLTALMYLYLDNNHFIGTIPPSLFNASLLGLDIGDNQISGKIPSPLGHLSRSFGYIPRLSTLILRENHLDGMIPYEFCKLKELRFLDLSDNHLSGPIPSCFNLTNLQHMHLEKNAFSGLIPKALSGCISIISLNIRYNNMVGVIPVWIGGLSKLRLLLLKGNNLHGHIPIELCQLKNLSLLDLSYNNLSGSLPSCINNLTFGRSTILDNAFRVRGKEVFDDGHPDGLYPFVDYEVTDELTRVEFITKRILNSYNGGLLKFMSGIDFSCNQLAGEIPLELGQLSGLHSLNLSYNQLSGPIPTTFKNLTQIESLDLSYNILNGTIPSELTELYYLAVFSVAHNNLSGSTPDMKFQFATFNESSYVGNPLLCGLPLNKSCISTTPTIRAPKEEEDDGDNGLVYFYASFIGSYSVFLLGTIAVLYFTSQRRAVCFLYIVDSWCAFRLYKLYRLFSCK